MTILLQCSHNAIKKDINRSTTLKKNIYNKKKYIFFRIHQTNKTMSAIIYKADCNFSVQIAVIIDKKYVMIGPEYKPGISNCVKYDDFHPPILSHKPKNYSCGQRCLDMYEALKPNFEYYGDLNETHLLGCLSMYVWIAKKCKIEHLIPNVLLGLIEMVIDFGDIEIYVAKVLQEKTKKISEIREWYFTQLSMQHKHSELIIDPKSGIILVTCFIPGILKYYMIKDLDQFNTMIRNLAETIEKNTKYFNFLHGSTHIGHISVDGKMIDFGESFNIYEKPMMEQYIEKYVPQNMKKKAAKKYKIQQIDVAAALTLVEIHTFFRSILDNIQKCPNLTRFKKEVLEMDNWILELLTEYFADEDLSIFTMIRKSNYSALFGGFEIPQDPSPINEKFPTEYFLEEFGLLKQMESNQ